MRPQLVLSSPHQCLLFLSLLPLSLCASFSHHCCHLSTEAPRRLPDNCSWLPGGPFAFSFPALVMSWAPSCSKAGGGYSTLMLGDVVNALLGACAHWQVIRGSGLSGSGVITRGNDVGHLSQALNDDGLVGWQGTGY